MATTITILGYTTVTIGTTLLGQTSAEDMITIEMQPHSFPIHTNSTGKDMPYSIIQSGLSAIVKVPLLMWDKTVGASIWTTMVPGAVLNGQIGNLGANIVGISVTITPGNSAITPYVFPNCIIESPMEISGFGIVEPKLMLTFNAYPPLEQNLYGAPTSAVYTGGIEA